MDTQEHWERAYGTGTPDQVSWFRPHLESSLSLIDVWHDRAGFHFLTDRRAYVRNVASAVKPGGHVIVGTFGPEVPKKCSDLDVMRYDAESLHNELGRHFRLIESSKELHQTPFGTTQEFLYCYCRVESRAPAFFDSRNPCPTIPVCES
jgi:hypothetical protein